MGITAIRARFPPRIPVALPLRSAAAVNAKLTTPQRQVTNTLRPCNQAVLWLQKRYMHVFGAMWCNLSPFKMSGLKSQSTEMHVNCTGMRCGSCVIHMLCIV